MILQPCLISSSRTGGAEPRVYPSKQTITTTTTQQQQQNRDNPNAIMILPSTSSGMAPAWKKRNQTQGSNQEPEPSFLRLPLRRYDAMRPNQPNESGEKGLWGMIGTLPNPRKVVPEVVFHSCHYRAQGNDVN